MPPGREDEAARGSTRGRSALPEVPKPAAARRARRLLVRARRPQDPPRRGGGLPARPQGAPGNHRRGPSGLVAVSAQRATAVTDEPAEGYAPRARVRSVRQPDRADGADRRPGWRAARSG